MTNNTNEKADKMNTREYTVYSQDVAGTQVFYAQYQPINAKTGQVWQASRSIMKGRDLWVVTLKTGETVLRNEEPKANQDWSTCRHTYSSRERAVSAVAKEQAKKAGELRIR